MSSGVASVEVGKRGGREEGERGRREEGGVRKEGGNKVKLYSPSLQKGTAERGERG